MVCAGVDLKQVLLVSWSERQFALAFSTLPFGPLSIQIGFFDSAPASEQSEEG